MNSVSILIERYKMEISKDLYKKTNSYGLYISLKILIPFAIILISPNFIYVKSYLNFIYYLLLFGWCAYRIQFILHDCSHKTLFAHLKTNEFIAYFSGLLIGVNFPMYRYTHMNHHRVNGDPIDPQYPDYLGGKNITKFEYLYFIFSPLLGGRLITYIKREILQLNINKERDFNAPKITSTWYVYLIIVQLIISLVVSKFGINPELIIAYYGGLGTISLFLARLRTIAEHQQVNSNIEDFSRSHDFSFIDWLFLYDSNFNYHLEHHLYPQVPAKNLNIIYNDHTIKIHTKNTHNTTMFNTILDIYIKLKS